MDERWTRTSVGGVSGARPRSCTVVAVVLCALAIVVCLAGLVLTSVSACCGSPDPPDGTYAFVGSVVAAGLALAGVALWTGWLRRWVLLVLTAGLPVASVVSGSADGAGIFVVTTLAWLAFAVFLRRPAPAAWFAARRQAR